VVLTSLYAACCDIGGTKVLLGLVDNRGQILARDRYLLGSERHPEQIAEELASRWRSLAAGSGLTWDDCVGVGCSAAVMGDIEQGIILTAPNMLPHHRNVPFRDMLQAAAGRPALMEMDAYAAALGEAWQGVGAGVDYFVYVVVGTGVGAGILMKGQVFRGWHGTAGEFGHTTVDPNGPFCNCGRYGCVEALASGPAIALRARGAVIQGRRTILAELAEPSGITPQVVFDAARRGDPVALEVVETTAYYLGVGLSNLVHVLDPQVIGLGGGVMRGGADILLEPVRREVARRCGSWVDLPGMKIALAALGEEAALLGVARLVWRAEARNQ
jgi:glucokinase-like ROK family protein